MIKPGIKIGPHYKWKHRFENTHASYCEIWYRADKPKWYKDTFKYLQKHNIKTGLHFWGIIDDKWEPNIAYPGESREKTIELISDTLHVAARHNCHYVNIHLGNYKQTLIDLEKRTMPPDPNSPEIPVERGEEIMSDSLKDLYQIADSLGVFLLVETVPAKIKLDPNDRNNIKNQFSMPPESLIRIAKKQKLLVTNDFCHTFSYKFDLPLEDLWKYLWKTSKALAPYTKLLHINTVRSPYNGTDSHDGITDEDYQNLPELFPTKEKLAKLLGIFKNRNDVWAINEPSKDHTGNYFALTRILNNL